MATNLALDDSLIEEALKIGNHRTKKEAVTAALQEYVQARKRRKIFELVGKVEYYEDYDPKQLRDRKNRERRRRYHDLVTCLAAASPPAFHGRGKAR